MGELLLLAGTAALVLTAVLAACCLRMRSFVSFLLTVFLGAWAILVVESMLLSLFDSWTRTGMLLAILGGLAAVLAARSRLGRPRPPAARPALDGAREALHDPVVVFVVGAAALGLAYELVVALLIPPLDIDVLAYHLPRVVMWMQQHSIASIPGSPGSNLDGNPPGAEIAKGLTMLLSETDRYVGLVQVTCVPAGSLAVAGIASRLGIGVHGAVLGGALFATFPIVALQAPTAHNDLAVAVLLLVALYFLLGQTTGELALGSVGIALGLTTKISGLLGLVSVALVALVAVPAARRLAVAAAVAAGCALGSWWYAYNLWRTGAWDGGLGSDYGQVPSRAPDEVLIRLERYLLQTLDLGGVVGRDRLVLPVLGVVVLAVAAALMLKHRRWDGLVIAAGLVAVSPWLIVAAHQIAARAFARSWIAVGRSEVIGAFPQAPEARPWPGEAWFGPAFPILVVAASVVCVLTTTGKRRIVFLTALLVAPTTLFLVNSIAFVWDGARGRFFILAGGLAATGFGLTLRFRPVAWACAVIAVASLGLSFVHFHGRPAGIELFEPVPEEALWGAPRWSAQEALAPDHAAAAETARTLAERVPEHATVGVVAGKVWTMYAVMGWGPWRTIRFLGDQPVPADVDYVAVAPGLERTLPSSEWIRVPGVTTWSLYRRA